MTTDRRTLDLDALLDVARTAAPDAPGTPTRRCAWCGLILAAGTPGAGYTDTVCDECDAKYLTEDAA